MEKKLEMFFDFIFHFGDGVVQGGESGDWFSLLVDDELCEVPLDEVAQHAALFGFQKLKEGMGVASVHIDLAEHVEGCALGSGKSLDFLIVARLLTAELVAGESKNP
jgi:hypothetical protein